MSQKIKTQLSLIEWCDQQVEEGKKLSIGWEGGGDSGWVYFKIDDEQIEETDDQPQVRELIDLMYDQLDYGSWAGEFSAQGEAIYNAEEKAFIGEDYYYEDQTVEYDCNIKIRVPKKLWFDVMEIEIREENAIVDAAFSIKNGFLTPEHDEWLETFKQEFEDEVDKVITAFCNDDTQNEYSSMWENIVIERNEFTEEGEFLVYELEQLAIGSRTTDDKDIYLELQKEETEDEE